MPNDTLRAARAALVPAALVAAALASRAPDASAQTITVGASGPAAVAPGATVALPIVLDMAQAGTHNVASVSFRVTWSAAALGFVSLDAGFGTLVANPSSAGGVTATVFNGTGVRATTTLATLVLRGAGSGLTTVGVQVTAIGSESGQSLATYVRTHDHPLCVGVPGAKYGDVNGDGDVDVLDAQQIARHAAGLGVADPSRLQRYGDVNADGVVNIIDAQLVSRFAAGLDVGSARVGQTSGAACTAGTSSVASVVISGGSALAPGQTVQLTATPRDAAGNAVAGQSIAWSSNAPSVAAVSATGVLTAAASGSATISATASGVTGTYAVTVTSSSTGRVVFWTDNYALAPIAVSVGGQNAGSVSAASATPPACGAAGAVTVTLPPGTSTFTASNAAGTTWGPSPVTVTSGQCSTMRLYAAAREGTLSVTLAAVPLGASPAVQLTAPGGYARTLTAGFQGTVPAGTYTLTAAPITVGGVAYAPQPATQTVAVADGGSASATVTYGTSAGTQQIAIVTANPVTVALNGRVDVTARVTGAGGARAAGVPVTWDIPGFTPTTFTTDASGESDVYFNPTRTGTFTGTAYIGAVGANGPRATFQFTVTQTTAGGAYDVDLRVVGTVPPTLANAASQAVQRLRQIIVSTPSPARTVDNLNLSACGSWLPPTLAGQVDGLVVYLGVASIDGPGNTLADAGPCYVWTDTKLPFVARIRYDVDDLPQYSSSDMTQIVLHELLHAVGFGASEAWSKFLGGAGTGNPYFTGTSAYAGWPSVGGPQFYVNAVPVENSGGAGSLESHWRDRLMGLELMTSLFTRGVTNPVSVVTLGALKDMGYGVNMGAAETYRVTGTSNVRESPGDEEPTFDRVLPVVGAVVPQEAAASLRAPAKPGARPLLPRSR